MISGKRREALRKLIHIGFGFLAFAVPFLGHSGSVILVSCAFVWNALLFPRLGGRQLWRPDEVARGRSAGMLLYPASLLFLLLIFPHRLEVAAAIWGLLAFGDGMATLLGTYFGRARLPWNSEKTWVGFWAYFFFGTWAVATLLAWTLAHTAAEGRSEAFLIGIAVVVALVAAFLESQPQALDDNLRVPLPAALLLFAILSSETYWASEVRFHDLLASLTIGLAANLGFGILAFRARSIDFSGLVAGTVLGAGIYTFLGWRGFLMLGLFFVLGTAATRLGYTRKETEKLAQESGGRRSARHAIANAGVPAVLAVLAATTPHEHLYLPAFVSALASATSDTLESEIGQLWGRKTRLITTFRAVPRGTDGAVSFEGTAAGLAGALILAVSGWAVGFYEGPVIGVVFGAGFAGSLVDSYLGATLERQGQLDNQAVNFICTLSGALFAIALIASVSRGLG